VEGEAVERSCVDGDPDGAPATLELAQVRLGVVNLQHDKLGEHPVNHERKKRGGGVLSFTGGGGRTDVAALCASGAPGV
jgi:Flp pilus assembly CpaE family ATPase